MKSALYLLPTKMRALKKKKRLERQKRKHMVDNFYPNAHLRCVCFGWKWFHFHPNPHVWLQRKIKFSGNHLPVDQNLRLWPENEFTPSFSLQFIFGKRERERERRESPDRGEREREREREKREPRSESTDRRAARSFDEGTRRSTSGAIDERCDRPTSALVDRRHSLR